MSANSDVRIREAATVVLLRDSDAGLQTWMLRRVQKMAFAAGMSVFPGGAVDAADAVVSSELLSDPVAEPVLQSIARQLGSTPSDAGRLMSAAIRETFEEVGVLLSRPVVLLAAGVRDAVERRELNFGQMLADSGVALDLTALRPWARWITPEGEARRYDTYFFVAVLPPGSAAEAVTSEASHADWIGVEQALAECRQGKRPMLPPTITTLTEIAAHSTTQEALLAAGERIVRPVRPKFVRDESGALTLDLGNGTVIQLPPDFVGASGQRR